MGADVSFLLVAAVSASARIAAVSAEEVADLLRARRLLAGSETSDANVLCDFYNTMPTAGKAQLTNWCGAKSGTGSYVNGPCTGTRLWAGVTCGVVGGASRVTVLSTWYGGVSGIGGSLPTSIGELDAVTRIELQLAGISGSIPSSLGALTGLRSLRLDINSLSGSIPSSLGGLTGLTSLLLSNNALTGPVPSSFCSFLLGGTSNSMSADVQVSGNPGLTCYPSCLSKSLLSKDFSLRAVCPSETSDSNVLCDWYDTMPATGNKAQLTNWCGAKSGTGIYDNGGRMGSYVNGPCTGTAGAWLGVTCGVVGGVNRVTRLDTWNSGAGVTSIGGSLPTSIGGLDAVTYLNLPGAGIFGSIPSSMAALTGLTDLRLTGNSLSGGIPSSLGGLTGLTFFALPINSLFGSIPSSLGALTGLTGLYLDQNSLTGPVPASFCSLKPSIQLFVSANPGLTCYPSCLATFSNFMRNKGDLGVCPAAPSESSKSSTTIIIAVVVSVGGVLVLIVALAYWCRTALPRKQPAVKGGGGGGGSYAPAGAAADSTWLDSNAEVREGAGRAAVATGAATLTGLEMVVLADVSLSVSEQPQGAKAITSAPPLPSVPVPAPVPAPVPLDAWEAGRLAVADASSSGSAAAAEALVPGLLSIAREFPLVGPCAGVLLQFYRVYKTVRANHAAYAALKEQCDLGANWMREIAPQLPSIDSKSALVEQALRRVVAAMHHTTQVMSALSLRLDAEAASRSRSLVSRVLGAVATAALSGADREKLSAALSWLGEAIAYLLQTIPTITGLQVKAKLDRVGDDVSAIMALLTDYSVDKQQAALRASKLQELTLQSNDISLSAAIGQGGFSTVYAGTFHNKLVAVKAVRRTAGGRLSQQEREAVENELLVTRYLADPNILTVYGFAHELDRTLMVLEFAPYGSLWELLYDEATFPTTSSSMALVGLGSSSASSASSSSGQSFPFSLSVGWLRDLSSAVAHIYARGVKHKDIKAENLLVYAYPDRLVAKLCDFGFARQSSATMSMASGGTANFEAPEVRATGKASFASDVFSCGMTAVQILTRQAPGRHDWQDQVNAAMSRQQSLVGPDSGLPPGRAVEAHAALRRLLLRMTDADQGLRPNAVECSAQLNAVLAALGGDPRTDPSAPDYDLVEDIEDRVKAARRAAARRDSTRDVVHDK